MQGIEGGWKTLRQNHRDRQRKADTLTQVKWMFVSRLVGKPGSTHGSNVTKYPLFLITFLFTVPCPILWGTTDFVLFSSRATLCHALNRTRPLSSGLTGVGDVDNARSALGRWKEHTTLLLSHNLMYTLTSYADNIPLLAAGDMHQVEGQTWTEETGKASRCKKKKAQPEIKPLLLSSIRGTFPFTGENSRKIRLHRTTVEMAF